jgi:hypothetical protein
VITHAALVAGSQSGRGAHSEIVPESMHAAGKALQMTSATSVLTCRTACWQPVWGEAQLETSRGLQHACRRKALQITSCR